MWQLFFFRFKDIEKHKLKRKLDTSLDSSKLKKRGRPPKDKALAAVQERERMMMTSGTAPHNAPVNIFFARCVTLLYFC